MALIADDAGHRVEQLLLLSERLAALIAEDTRRIDAREPLQEGPAAEEKARLANAYRLELARIKQDPSLVSGAAPDMLIHLKSQTLALQEALAAHEIALGAVKLVSEGLVHAIAEETVRQQSGGLNYSAQGGLAQSSAPTPAILNRRA